MKTELEMQNKIQLFENSKIRSVWDDEKEKWYFAIVDVIAILSESENPSISFFHLLQEVSKRYNL